MNSKREAAHACLGGKPPSGTVTPMIGERSGLGDRLLAGDSAPLGDEAFPLSPNEADRGVLGRKPRWLPSEREEAPPTSSGERDPAAPPFADGESLRAAGGLLFP